MPTLKYMIKRTINQYSSETGVSNRYVMYQIHSMLHTYPVVERMSASIQVPGEHEETVQDEKLIGLRDDTTLQPLKHYNHMLGLIPFSQT